MMKKSLLLLACISFFSLSQLQAGDIQIMQARKRTVFEFAQINTHAISNVLDFTHERLQDIAHSVSGIIYYISTGEFQEMISQPLFAQELKMLFNLKILSQDEYKLLVGFCWSKQRQME